MSRSYFQGATIYARANTIEVCLFSFRRRLLKSALAICVRAICDTYEGEKDFRKIHSAFFLTTERSTRMTPSFVPSIVAFFAVLSLGATLSLPASSSSVPSLTILASNPQLNSTESAQSGDLNGWTWFWISSDGSQIVPVSGP